MKNTTRVIRGANFAYPWSERAEFFAPRAVRLMIGISALLVLALVSLPFVFAKLEQQVLVARGLENEYANALRIQVEEARPILQRKAALDTLKEHLDTRVALRQEIAAADYPIDRLLLHLSEIVPDGIVLQNINIQPVDSRARGRPGTVTQSEELPEEIAPTFTLTLGGSARNSDNLSELYSAIDESPLFWGRNQTIRPQETTLDFTITCRLPGSGAEITGEGG